MRLSSRTVCTALMLVTIILQQQQVTAKAGRKRTRQHLGRGPSAPSGFETKVVPTDKNWGALEQPLRAVLQSVAPERIVNGLPNPLQAMQILSAVVPPSDTEQLKSLRQPLQTLSSGSMQANLLQITVHALRLLEHVAEGCVVFVYHIWSAGRFEPLTML